MLPLLLAQHPLPNRAQNQVAEGEHLNVLTQTSAVLLPIKMSLKPESHALISLLYCSFGFPYKCTSWCSHKYLLALSPAD